MKTTAEQVRRGMVFEQLATGARVTTVRPYERPGSIASLAGMWECNPGGVLVEAGPDFAFLGCDPALAARADCEQYGIAPGCDAAAHGFARTREGKAHDMRRSMPVGSIYTYDDEPAKERRIVRTGPAFLPSGCSFVGLRADVADWRDGAYLCCGTAHAPPGETFKHITETGKRAVCCTLAIGDHAEHEDIAAGVKWPAKEEQRRPNPPAFTYSIAAALPYTRAEWWTSSDALAASPNDFRFDGNGDGLKPYAVGTGLLFNDGSGDVRRAEAACAKCSTRPATHTWTMANDAGSARAEVCAGCFESVIFNPRAWTIRAGKVEARRGFGLTGIDSHPARDSVADARCPLCYAPPNARTGCSTCRPATADGWRNYLTDAPAPAPQAPKVSPTAARDAAVAKAAADVPAGCSAAGWRNVVHVLAADTVERCPTFDSWGAASIGDLARPYVIAYERERRAGYGKEQAAKRSGAAAAGFRLLAAYEAGR